MYIKKIIIGGIILVATALTIKAIANRNMTAEQKLTKVTEKMAKRLKLSEEQKLSIYEINLERARGMKKAYEAGRKKEIAQAVVAKWETDLSQVLTDRQIKKMGL